MFAKWWFTFCLFGLLHTNALGQQTEDRSIVGSETSRDFLPKFDAEELLDELVACSDPLIMLITLVAGDEYGFAPNAVNVLPKGYDVSPEFRLIVAMGFDSVPVLLKHLDDDRVVNCDPSGIYWQSNQDEYDFNRATCENAPEGVNKKGTSFSEFETFTVGDVCFNALGQILNRHWRVTWPQESGGISSPTRSAALRKAILEEWNGLTREEHRAKLIADFERPDSVNRVLGAYRRLAYYYPDSIEPLVLEFLNRPVVEPKTYYKFITEILGAEEDAIAGLVKEFTIEHGEHSSYIVQQMLFQKIYHMNVYDPKEEEVKVSHLLHREFDWPIDVTFDHWTRLPKTVFTKQEFARVIKCFRNDQSEAVGFRIQEILESKEFFETSGDRELAKACMASLMSRKSHHDYLAESIERIDFETNPELESLMSDVIKWHADEYEKPDKR